MRDTEQVSGEMLINSIPIIPAKAGIHVNQALKINVDPRFRENDELISASSGRAYFCVGGLLKT
jgi:hypothetical protein